VLLRDKISHALENKRGYEQLLKSDTSFIAAQIFICTYMNKCLFKQVLHRSFIWGKFHVDREKSREERIISYIFHRYNIFIPHGVP